MSRADLWSWAVVWPVAVAGAYFCIRAIWRPLSLRIRQKEAQRSGRPRWRKVRLEEDLRILRAWKLLSRGSWPIHLTVAQPRCARAFVLEPSEQAPETTGGEQPYRGPAEAAVTLDLSHVHAPEEAFSLIHGEFGAQDSFETSIPRTGDLAVFSDPRVWLKELVLKKDSVIEVFAERNGATLAACAPAPVAIIRPGQDSPEAALSESRGSDSDAYLVALIFVLPCVWITISGIGIGVRLLIGLL